MNKKYFVVLTFLIFRVSFLDAQTVLHPWHVDDAGGGESISGGTALRASIGQPAIQAMTSSGASLESGYLPGLEFLSGVSAALVDGLSGGWNLISDPVIPSNDSVSSLFPDAVSHAFAYTGGYAVSSRLRFGTGYWLKFPSGRTDTLEGGWVTSDSIGIEPGWNMIGSLSVPVPVSSITSDSPGVILSSLYSYNQSYRIADSILPGKGYWVKANKPCNLILSSGSGSTTMRRNRVAIVPTSERPPSPPEEASGAVVSNQLPAEYGLNQCYPNPFNPATTIRYQLPTSSRVSLRVYNLLGQLIEILEDGVEGGGYKEATWNASAFASGVYFYRLEATSVSDPGRMFTDMKKMLLVK